MDGLRLAEHVDGIFYPARLGTRKPDAEFYGAVQAAVGLRGAELLLVDDSRENVDGARNAGWQALHWTRGSSPALVRGACGLPGT
jgi:putative hydrolase of the HAD superfamily